MPKIETLDERIKALSAHWRLYKPDGPGPFRLVVLMHGCGGCHPFQDEYARAAAAAGVAALVVDSYPHREIAQAQALSLVCTGLKLWGRERAGDLFAAMAWARTQSFVDRDGLFVSGWSHGGWTVLDALALCTTQRRVRWTGLIDLDKEPMAGLAGAFVFYPYFGMASIARASGLRATAPVSAIVCGRDSVVGGRSLEAALRATPKPGAPIEITYFANATHAFDEPDTGDPRFRYDPVLTRQATALWLDLLTGSIC
jgi:dienelactone hydrolase